MPPVHIHHHLFGLHTNSTPKTYLASCLLFRTPVRPSTLVLWKTPTTAASAFSDPCSSSCTPHASSAARRPAAVAGSLAFPSTELRLGPGAIHAMPTVPLFSGMCSSPTGRDRVSLTSSSFDNDPSPMMDRFVREQPTVAERLLAGAAPRSLTGLQDQTDGMVRRLEYVADEYRPRM